MIEELRRVSDLCERNAIEINMLKKTNREAAKSQVETHSGRIASVDGGIYKGIYFNSEDGSGVCFNAEITSDYSEQVTCIVLINGKQILNEKTRFPINKEIAFLPEKGENSVVCSIFSTGSNFSADVSFKISGYIVNQPIGGYLRYLNDGYSLFHDGDTLKFVHTSDLSTAFSMFGVKYCAVSALNSGWIIMTYDKTGNARFVKVTLPYFSVTDLGIIKSGFTSCAIRPYNEGFIVYGIKDNCVYAYISNGETSTLYGKLPIKAIEINFSVGEMGEYLYYTDLRDNINVLKLAENAVYQPIGRYSLGKKKNLTLAQTGGNLKILYLSGEVVVERSIGDLSDVSVVGKGSQGIKLANGDFIILRDGNLLLIKGE